MHCIHAIHVHVCVRACVCACACARARVRACAYLSTHAHTDMHSIVRRANGCVDLPPSHSFAVMAVRGPCHSGPRGACHTLIRAQQSSYKGSSVVRLSSYDVHIRVWAGTHYDSGITRAHSRPIYPCFSGFVNRPSCHSYFPSCHSCYPACHAAFTASTSGLSHRFRSRRAGVGVAGAPPRRGVRGTLICIRKEG